MNARVPEVDEDDDADPQSIRLQVLLARCGLGSRRACEEYITMGRVDVDGETVTELGTRVTRGQKVRVDGESLRPERVVYYVVNKPKGVLCTNSDPQGRLRVSDMLPANAGRLFPVGRLDENTVGLLLVTNDGESAHRLAHPKYRVPKTYQVQVAGTPTWETLEQLKKGMFFSDGRFQVEGIRKLKTKGQSSILEVVLNEGQNRELRRLFARVGHKVVQLERVGFGPLRLKGVPPGAYRPLTREEVKQLHDFIEQSPARIKERPVRKPAPKVAASVVPVRTGPSIVEIAPLERRGGRDITGQPRELVQARARSRFEDDDDDDDEDEDAPRQGRHPAMADRPPRSVAVGKPRMVQSDERPRRKAAEARPRRPVGAGSGQRTGEARTRRPANAGAGKPGRRPAGEGAEKPRRPGAAVAGAGRPRRPVDTSRKGGAHPAAERRPGARPAGAGAKARRPGSKKK